jgi:uncharacterized protein YlxW (UPF0749 family)
MTTEAICITDDESEPTPSMVTLTKFKLATLVSFAAIISTLFTSLGAYAIQGYQVKLNTNALVAQEKKMESQRDQSEIQLRDLTRAIYELGRQVSGLQEAVESLKRQDDRRSRQ